MIPDVQDGVRSSAVFIGHVSDLVGASVIVDLRLGIGLVQLLLTDLAIVERSREEKTLSRAAVVVDAEVRGRPWDGVEVIPLRRVELVGVVVVLGERQSGGRQRQTFEYLLLLLGEHQVAECSAHLEPDLCLLALENAVLVHIICLGELVVLLADETVAIDVIRRVRKPALPDALNELSSSTTSGKVVDFRIEKDRSQGRRLRGSGDGELVVLS